MRMGISRTMAVALVEFLVKEEEKNRGFTSKDAIMDSAATKLGN